METEKLVIKFKKKNWNIKVTDRSRGRMKLQIKLGTDESEAFTSFTKTMKPDNISEGEFLKMIFFMGIDTVQKTLQENLVKHMEANRPEFEAKGVKFDEHGKLMVGQAEKPEVIMDDEPEIVK